MLARRDAPSPVLVLWRKRKSLSGVKGHVTACRLLDVSLVNILPFASLSSKRGGGEERTLAAMPAKLHRGIYCDLGQRIRSGILRCKTWNREEEESFEKYRFAAAQIAYIHVFAFFSSLLPGLFINSSCIRFS